MIKHMRSSKKNKAVILVLGIALALALAIQLAIAQPEERAEVSTQEVVSLDTDRQVFLKHKQELVQEQIEDNKVERFYNFINYTEAVAAEEARQAAIREAARKERARKAAEAQKAATATSSSGGVVYSGDVWHALAMCETGGKMDNPNTGNGYYGYFQFALSTWESVGGTGYPHQHSYETQKSFAQKLQARSGWGQWPRCSRKLGLR